jgi:hypothetical protein
MYRYILLTVSLLAAWAVQAQTTMTVEAPRVVVRGEPFRIAFVVNAETSDFKAPDLSDFAVLAGPTPGSSYMEQIVNGRRSSQVSKTFTYIVEAGKEGKFTIKGASATVDGKQINCEPFVIEVIKPEENAAGNRQGSGTGSLSDDDLFMRVELNKKNVVKGEPITATIKLYTRVGISQIEDIHFPAFNGFWSQEQGRARELTAQEENVNGRIYRASVLLQYILIPQQTGEIKIDPAEAVCVVQLRTEGSGLIDAFFGNVQNVRKRIVAPGQTVHVSALPAGAPASFTGAVGKYSISAAWSKDSIQAHEAVSLVVKISGQGNTNLVEAPRISFPADFETYEMKTTDQTQGGATAISGTKVFEFPVIPRSAGRFTIEPISFSYYDVSSKQYLTVKTPELTLRVGRGTGNTAPTVYDGGVSQMVVKDLGQDIRYIYTGLPALLPIQSFFMGSMGFWLLAGALVLGFFVLYQLLLRRRERNKNVVLVRSRKANKQARMRLKTAGSFLKQAESARFYEEIDRALWGYMGDKLGIPPADHATERVVAMLYAHKAPDSSIQEFSDLIAHCAFARYAPSAGSGEMDKIYDRALQLISQLEPYIK